ncbi:MAG: hypothetical protein ACRCVX_16170 [Shewanella sp.]
MLLLESLAVLAAAGVASVLIDELRIAIIAMRASEAFDNPAMDWLGLMSIRPLRLDLRAGLGWLGAGTYSSAKLHVGEFECSCISILLMSHTFLSMVCMSSSN